MSRTIIGLVGRQGSGKGTAAKILKEKYGAQLFRFSEILGDILNRLTVLKTRDNMIKLSETLRAAFGEDVLAYAIERDAANATSDIVVIDGIRRIGDIAVLEPLPHFKLVEISAPANIRYERMTHRGEKSGESSMTWEGFELQELASPEITIPAVAARAWKTIENNGTTEDLEEKIDQMMLELNTL